MQIPLLADVKTSSLSAATQSTPGDLGMDSPKTNGEHVPVEIPR